MELTDAQIIGLFMRDLKTETTQAIDKFIGKIADLKIQDDKKVDEILMMFSEIIVSVNEDTQEATAKRICRESRELRGNIWTKP